MSLTKAGNRIDTSEMIEHRQELKSESRAYLWSPPSSPLCRNFESRSTLYPSESPCTHLREWVTVISGDRPIKKSPSHVKMGPTTTKLPWHAVSDIMWRNKCHQLLSFIKRAWMRVSIHRGGVMRLAPRHTFHSPRCISVPTRAKTLREPWK